MERNRRQERKSRQWRDERREYKYRRRRQELHRKILGFCLFTFLLGVLFGKIVFAKETGLLEQAWRLAEGRSSLADNKDRDGFMQSSVENGNLPSVLDSPDQDDWKLTLVNASCPLEEGYTPKLSEIENNYYFDARAVSYLQKMLADGRKE